MAARKQDWNSVEALFEYGVDVDNRRVYLLGDVEEGSIGNAIKALYMLGRSKETIELFVGSFGGSEYDMFALYDVLQSIACPVSTVAIGKCMSAAPLLVAAGTLGHRWTMGNAQWMIHRGEGDYGASRIETAQADLDHYRSLDTRWFDLMSKHSNKTPGQWRKHCLSVGDKYFSAAEAVEWGLVDHIWDQKEGE
jgi:ATP-dependent Clp protease protease subunit